MSRHKCGAVMNRAERRNHSARVFMLRLMWCLWRSNGLPDRLLNRLLGRR